MAMEKVINIESKRPDTIFAIRSKMGMVIAKEAPEADETCLFVDAVEMLQVQTERGMGIIGTLIGKLITLPGTEDAPEYFVYELSNKSAYATEYRRVVSGIVEAPSGIIV